MNEDTSPPQKKKHIWPWVAGGTMLLAGLGLFEAERKNAVDFGRRPARDIDIDSDGDGTREKWRILEHAAFSAQRYPGREALLRSGTIDPVEISEKLGTENIIERKAVYTAMSGTELSDELAENLRWRNKRPLETIAKESKSQRQGMVNEILYYNLIKKSAALFTASEPGKTLSNKIISSPRDAMIEVLTLIASHGQDFKDVSASAEDYIKRIPEMTSKLQALPENADWQDITNIRIKSAAKGEITALDMLHYTGNTFSTLPYFVGEKAADTIEALQKIVADETFSPAQQAGLLTLMIEEAHSKALPMPKRGPGLSP